MRITEIRHSSVPIEGNVSNSIVNFAGHTVSLVAVVSDVVRAGKPLTGIAFNSIGRYAQSGLLDARFIPRVLAANPEDLLLCDGTGLDPAAITTTLMANEKPGGHGDRAGAVAAIELAIWDLNAKLHDEPASETIARHFGRGTSREPVPVYAAGGYYRKGCESSHLVEEVNRYKQDGYTAFKIKIGGATLPVDLNRIESVLASLPSANMLAVDANGRFDRRAALEYASALNPYSLGWYEEPGDPLDYELNAAVTDVYAGAVATGENLFATQDTINLLRYGCMRPKLDIFQMDAGLSYGLTNYAASIAAMEAAGHDRTQARPHGGHLINLHIVHGLQLGGCESYPGVFEPFGGYSPQVTIVDGTIEPTDAPGFGLEQKPAMANLITQLAPK